MKLCKVGRSAIAGPTISTAKTENKMHVGIFYICKHVPYFDYTSPQQLAKTVYKQAHDQVPTMPTCFTGV
jgi:hypothetical protein